MNIETKFKEGDTIHFIHEAKALSSICRGFKIERLMVAGTDQYRTDIIYLLNHEDDQRVNIRKAEQFCFPTKESLLESL